MNQNTFVVFLINTKEKLHTFYQNRNKIVKPILKGLLAFAVLFFIARIFPYNTKANHTWVLAAISVLLAFLPISLFYYVVTAFILVNLWSASFDIMLAFFACSFIFVICYFRMDNKYSYLAVVVPVLFYLKLGYLVPAVLAYAVGFHALVPTIAGIVTYFASLAVQDSVSLLNAGTETTEEMGLMKLVDILINNHTFHIVLIASCITILLTSAVYKLFHEQAWIMAAFAGNIVMAVALIGGSLYWKIELVMWIVIAEMVAGALLCLFVELFRGIGDVTRIEKVIFEDDEYVYYVKAVPKIKVAQSDRNVKIMNETILENEEEEETGSSGPDEIMEENTPDENDMVENNREEAETSDDSMESEISYSEEAGEEETHSEETDFGEASEMNDETMKDGEQ